MKRFNVAIIGGGAAGTMAAIWASRNGKPVVLIERNDKIGKKILATGNGRCNLTNLGANSSRYHGASPEFIDLVLEKFDQKKTMKFFEERGLILKEEDHGRIFPRNNQAKSVTSLLEYELEKNKVTLMTNSLVRKIEKDQEWKIVLENGQQISADKLILTTGGKAAHHLGSSGDGYYWAQKLAHKIVDTYPALVPIETKEKWVKLVQGVKVEGKVTTTINRKVVAEKFGDILFTHFGVSGPAIMAQARSIGPNLNSNILKIHLDLYPEEQIERLDEKLKSIFGSNGAKSVKNSLAGVVPSSLSESILGNLSINTSKKSAELSKIDRRRIAETIKNIELTPVKLLPFREAQVTAGGISSDEINPNSMQSKIVPNLYFAGEIIDVDGDSGGFNLQWAWSSGYVAGTSSAR